MRKYCAMNLLKMFSVKSSQYGMHLDANESISSCRAFVSLKKRLLCNAGDIAQYTVRFVEMWIGADRIDRHEIYRSEFK